MSKVKIVYTITELAEMAGETRYRMRRLLESNGVKLHRSGPKRTVVMLSQLKKAFPDLWDSIEERLLTVED